MRFITSRPKKSSSGQKFARLSVGKIDYSLYFVCDGEVSGGHDLERLSEEAILGGASIVQLRMKKAKLSQFIETGRKLKAVCRKYKVPFIINDRVDIALLLNADGVHVGQSDFPAREARRLLGKKKIIGVSAENLSEALTAQKDGADYLGLQAVFPTSSKDDVGGILGLEGLKEICTRIQIPAVGIGGITLENAKSVVESGASGIAVISAVSMAENPRKAAEKLLACLGV